ncbi:hypothetical protein ACQP2T_04510 [Nonomuraea sp. CA-143628]|uniref:DUF4190 domain-containing protein n=1 Tax=Nonomuraea sp. CA-143628 TaxID=3239997 RepID=UPI003D913294
MTTPGDPNQPRPNDGDQPPEEEPRPRREPGKPFHPDLPTAPETPGPAEVEEGGEAEETQVFPTPGARPSYPGWDDEGAEPRNGAPGPTPPSRYEPPTTPEGEVPPSPGGPPRYEPPTPPPASPQGEPPSPQEERPSFMPQPPSYGEAGPQPPSYGEAGPQPPSYGETGPQPPSYGEGQPPGPPPRTEPIPAVPGTSPSSPYGGPPGGGGPGYGPPPGGAYPPGGQYQQGGPYQPYQAGPPAPPGSGLATASLVLGVASPFLVFVCFTGLLTAILSIVFGCVALSKGVGRGRAIAGIAVSVFALIIFTVVAIWFWSVVQECGHLPGQLADQCFESKFPWMRRTR